MATASLNYGSGEVRLTEDQNVILVGLPNDKLEALKADALVQRFPLEPGHISAGTVSCTGNTYCGFASPTPRTKPWKQPRNSTRSSIFPKS